MRAWPLVLLALALAPSAAASGHVWFYPGGEPGVDVTIEARSIASATSPGEAIEVDPAAPVNLSISISPPPNVTWRVAAVSVGLLVGGADSEPPSALTRRSAAEATLPPGYTVVVNKSVELASLKRVGAGTFLMQAEVLDENETQLYAQTFFVRVPGGVAELLTVQGAALTTVSVATGYGFWQLFKDGKEFRDAYARHRKKAEIAKLDVIGRAEETAEHLVEKGGRPLASAVSLHRAAQASERKLGPVRWTATGLGLGGVGIAWAQFFGYVAFDYVGLVVTALEVGAVFLTLALVANALVARARAKHATAQAEAQAKAEAEADATRTLIPEAGPRPAVDFPAAPPGEPLVAGNAREAVVHQDDKRG